jgi:3-dehydroquinate dehydratase / shikimate dehydrogenase
MTARVCVCIREATTAAAVEAMDRAAQWADLVEVRADYIRDLDLPRLFARKPCPVLFTLRSAQEGGEYRGAERSRLEAIVEAGRAGADLVDIEFSAFWKAIFGSLPRHTIVLSYHNFEAMPDDLESMVDRMAETGAGVLKIAVRARNLMDSARILRLLDSATEKRLNLCALAMGTPGVPTRVLGPRHGSWTTFASLPGGDATADGQLPADELIDLYRVRNLSRATSVYGVAGNPVGHSRSPLLHNKAFAARNLDAVYLPLEAADVDDLLEFADYADLRGLSVTIPFKEHVRQRVRSISVEAEKTGAVNTLVRSAQGWHGENTDVDGFLWPLLRRTQPSKLKSVVLGAGGAARAVVFGLRTQGSPVCVVARNADKARELAKAFGAEWAHWEQLERLDWDLLVNATPVGMIPKTDESPMRPDWLRGEWVYDLVYNPVETKLLRDAAKQRCRTIPGTEMFLGQAAKQQRLWVGSPMPLQEMSQALEAAMQNVQERREVSSVAAK